MRRSKMKIALVMLGIAAIVLAVNVAIRWKTPTPRQLIIEVTGTAGRAVEARFVADGNERKHSGTIPTEFRVEAHELLWEVERLDGPDKEKFKVAVHSEMKENWGGYAESDQVVRGGSIGAVGLRRQRAWLGRPPKQTAPQ